MKLEDQVCSLDLAKRLKELGVKQESFFTWVIRPKDEYYLDPYIEELKTAELGNRYNKKYGYPIYDLFSSFTCSEFGELLEPLEENGEYFFFCSAQDISGKYYCGGFCSESDDCVYIDENENEHELYFEADTEANARAKMLVYLLENKLINL